ncbi:uncharacterized protein HD556DRAFT_1479402 [Suillus plorans]|uniref:Uncharacterized protein n=1 Tax=Suillus plorans TaxID=116603 RepID=A0A9P7DH59_9AGAM|nr:uncharacterized protein HD556DRAFT_1479402 [Suillus plorans]KAG1793298.1 hypothetical protein HD556DRAFT_1479402 [Suillus plorans]
MDFKEFEVDIERAIENSELSKSCTITETLDWVDSTWYAPQSRNARWMDLIGDYASAEPFVIDGTRLTCHSLLQVVLDDCLLALAKDDEHILQNFRNRSANFDIVFIDGNRHLVVLRAGELEFIVASRALARRLLYKHLQSLDSVNTFTFTSLFDKKWLDYRARVKVELRLTKWRGLAMAPLQGANFKDTKILTFVFESKLRSSHGGHFPNAVLSAGVAARNILTSHEQGPFDQVRSCVLGEASVSPSVFDLCATLKDVGLSYLSAFKSDTQPLLLAVFIIHVLLLKNVSVQDRARRLPSMKPDLFTSLTKSFLPHILRATEAVIVADDASLDIDIRVFLCILRYLSEHPAQSLTEVLGPTVVKDGIHGSKYGQLVTLCFGGRTATQLFIAPTSAGKTFISYYAMEKILRGSDDGILVYIAPTKALVAQAAAEIYARKDLNGHEYSWSCWAIHSRDYRVHDPQNCQILVTVPDILAIMLLSPPLAKMWTPRLKYAHSLPSDLALEAVDTLHLYHALSTCKALQPSILAALDPAVFFSSSKLLQQKDVIQYEEALKRHLVPLLSSFDSQDSGTPLSRVIVQLQDDDSSRLPDRMLNSAPSRVLPIFTHQGDLPGIFFSFDRSNCKYMAKILNRVLEIKEDRWRKTSPEWKRKMAQYHAYLQSAKERERQAARASKHKADEEDKRADTSEWQASFRPDDPVSDFSFAGQGISYTPSELEEDIADFARRKLFLPEWAMKCLRRGIAVHHAGTLALGINAPTKTSIFCGDSPFLTALMYRQCAGRAGRRGYDTLGKVVFYALPMSRVQRLVFSKLPSLSASFPVTSTLVVRLFNLLEGSDYSTTAVAAVQRLFRLPRIGFGSEEGRYQLLHHIGFSIVYLRRAHLLDEQGKPLDLFGIAAYPRCMSDWTGDLSIAEELLTQDIHTNANDFTSYANRSFIMALKHNLDHALEDASRSSLTGFISKGIALCGKGHVREARVGFDVASMFTNQDSAGSPMTSTVSYHVEEACNILRSLIPNSLTATDQKTMQPPAHGKKETVYEKDDKSCKRDTTSA